MNFVLPEARLYSPAIVDIISVAVIPEIRQIKRDEYVFADIQVNGGHGNHLPSFYLNQSLAYLQWKPPAVFCLPLHTLQIEVPHIPNSFSALMAQSKVLFSSSQKTGFALGEFPNL